MLVELRHAATDLLIDRVDFDEPPMPGVWFSRDANTFFVMQKRHRYALRFGRYELASIVLMVIYSKKPIDAHLYDNCWVIGDFDCRFNARNPLLRCAVMPEGPCDSCVHRESRPDAG